MTDADSRSMRTWRFGERKEELQSLLDRGGVLAIPTESSYGLAADPSSEEGVAAIFRMKERPADEPLPVVFSRFEQLDRLGVSRHEPALQLLATAGPSALSVIVETHLDLPAAAGRRSLAVRRPDHARLLELLSGLDRPLTATSANRSGDVALCDPAEVSRWLADFDAAVVADGVLAGGEPSTLVVADGGTLRVLRAGRFPPEQAQEMWRQLRT